MVSGRQPGADEVLGTSDLKIRHLLPRSMAWFPQRLFLSFRLVTRLFEALIALEEGFDRGWPLALAAVGCALLDLLLAPLLSGPGRRLLPRVVLDTVDVTLWSLALPGAGDITVIAASPLVFEACLWYGVRGLVVAAVIAGAATATVGAAGHFTLLTCLWPTFAGISGMLAGRYLLFRSREEARLMRHHLEAAVSQAELAGQNSVAMGADSVVDLLVRTAPLIAQYEPSPIPAPFSSWKAAIAEACGRQSTYLGVALIRWQRLYNSRSPDLSGDVELRVAPGAGTLLLSPRQARDLEAQLDELGLRGTVPVDASRLGAPGRQQVIVVDGRPLTVPADPTPRAWPVIAAPFAFVAGAMITLVQSAPQWEAVPLWVTGPIAALNLLAAWWSHRRADQDPQKLAGQVIAVALLLGTVQAVATSAAMRIGSDRLPFLFFLHWVGPLVYIHAQDLRRARRPLVVAGLVGAVGAGMAAMPVSFSIVGTIVGFSWFIPPLLAVKGVREVIQQDTVDVRAQRRLLHDEAVRDGFRRGRLLIVDLTTDAVDQLRGRYRALGTELPRHMGEEIERRLDEAGTMLAAATAASD
jgi:hypothetical protein